VSVFVLLYTLSRARCFSDAVPACLRQYLYFCTSKASKLSTFVHALSLSLCLSDAVLACLRQNLYFRTSKASKVSTCVRVFLTCRRRLALGLLLLVEDAYVSIRPSAYVSIRMLMDVCCFFLQKTHTSAYVHQHTSAYASIRQHTSAYVSIRAHTSAYVSIRQHTSAYVSTGVRGRFFFFMLILCRLQQRGALLASVLVLLYQ
jgi:hypothetical protein